MEKIFKIKTETEGIDFIGNKETGKWVITNKFNENVRKKISGPFIKKPFNRIDMLVLNMGRECNFNCSYCFIGDLKNKKETLNEEVGVKALERASELPQNQCKIVFHGSEPMMNYQLIKKLILKSREINRNYSFRMQSNGSLFTNKKIDFLTKNKVGIGKDFVEADVLEVPLSLGTSLKKNPLIVNIIKLCSIMLLKRYLYSMRKV